MTKFHEGQDVEVRILFTGKLQPTVGSIEIWRTAKILASPFTPEGRYGVQLSDGTPSVFDVEDIRPVSP